MLFFDLYEEQRAIAQKVPPIPWAKLQPRFQLMWLRITGIVMEMAITVIMADAVHFLENSNGDLGAAFAKALRRYADEVLDTKL